MLRREKIRRNLKNASGIAFPSDEILSAEGRHVKEGTLGDVKWSSTQAMKRVG